MELKEKTEDKFDGEGFDEIIEEEISSEPETDKEKEQLKKLREEVKRQKEDVIGSKFARVESKPEFASEIINAISSQKVANLDDNQISELLEKRKFINLLKNFGWQRLAKRIIDNVADVEDYSLSKDGFLPRQVFTETTKSAQYSYELNKKDRKNKKEV